MQAEAAKVVNRAEPSRNILYFFRAKRQLGYFCMLGGLRLSLTLYESKIIATLLLYVIYPSIRLSSNSSFYVNTSCPQAAVHIALGRCGAVALWCSG